MNFLFKDFLLSYHYPDPGKNLMFSENDLATFPYFTQGLFCSRIMPPEMLPCYLSEHKYYLLAVQGIRHGHKSVISSRNFESLLYHRK